MTVDASIKSPKPFLKWVGGKGRLAVQLKALMPTKYQTFYEPFVGGGALYFYLQPKKAHINDVNQKLIGAYQNIQQSVEKIITELQALQEKYYRLDEAARQVFFYERRQEYNDLQDSKSLRKTGLLIFLNKTCYNGMYRENARGGFNVPSGNYKQPLICDAETLRADAQALSKATITANAFEKVAAQASKGDFVYFDPPYHPISKSSNFTSYSEGGFSEKDQIKLKELVDNLTKRGVLVMLSNSSAEFIKDLYKDYRQETVMANRAINSKGKGRGKIAELVVLNYAYAVADTSVLPAGRTDRG